MKLSEVIYDGGLIEEITRITGATIAVYTNKARVAHLNNALDQYWFLAAEAAPQGTFDDTNQTSAPVETQSLVSGTNAYKVSSFTNEVLGILRVAVLDDSAVEYDLEYVDFDDVADFTTTFAAATTGLPQYWTKLGDYIYISPSPNYSETNGLRCYVNRELSKFNWVTFTVTQASPAVFSATGHGLVANDAIILETDGTLLTGLTADTVLYYVISAGLTADVFEVSTTIGGSAVNTTVTQSGNHKFTKVTKEPGIPIIHHPFLIRYASEQYMKSDHPKFGKIREQLALDRHDIQEYWRTRDRETKTIIETSSRAFR